MSCSCGTCNGCLSTDTISIPTGANGQNGSNGVFGGFSGSWLFDSSTSTGPATTNLRFNNATLASVSEIYVNDTNKDSVDYSAFLASFSNGSDFGTVRVFKRYDSTQFWIGTVTAVTDNTTDYTIAVTWISSNGTFTDAEELVLSFTASGANGATGASVGAAYVVDVDYAGTITAADAGPSVLGTVTVGAGVLASDDDMLEFEAYYTSTVIAPDAKDIFYLSIGAVQFSLWAVNSTQAGIIKGRILRESSVLAHCVTEVSVSISSTGIVSTFLTSNTAAQMIGSQTIAIDWSQANIIELGITNTANETITLTDLVVKFVQQGA